MLSKRFKLSTVLLLGLGIAGLQAQTAVTSTGGNASGSGGSVSYTTGQIVYTTNTGAGGSVAQGVQQPYEISVPTRLEEAKDISLVFLAYPNPASDFLTLKVGNYYYQNLSFMLYDMRGNLLENKKVTGTQTDISMGNLIPGTYFLRILDNQKEIKTYKIIKN
jgi:hypothetical protein